jgi:hypothetical protein
VLPDVTHYTFLPDCNFLGVWWRGRIVSMPRLLRATPTTGKSLPRP